MLSKSEKRKQGIHKNSSRFKVRTIGKLHETERFTPRHRLNLSLEGGRGRTYHLMSAHDYGFVTQVSDSQGHVCWSNPVYDFRGRVTQFTKGNGEVTTHTYDSTRQEK